MEDTLNKQTSSLCPNFATVQAKPVILSFQTQESLQYAFAFCSFIATLQAAFSSVVFAGEGTSGYSCYNASKELVLRIIHNIKLDSKQTKCMTCPLYDRNHQCCCDIR